MRLLKHARTAALLLTSLWAACPAYALQQPRAIATDSRIRTLRFSENEVYQFIGHYGFTSSIEFAADETIKTVAIGDSVAWMVNPSGNRLFLKPIEQNALTNMTVLTDKHSYLFELHSEETKNIRDKDLVFNVRFVYPQNEVSETGVSQFEEFPEIDKHPEKFNLSYSVRGSSLIEPLRIFDDGEFTFFEFRDKNADIPAFFRVNADLQEELVNFRKRGDYVVVERVASRFTLRRGPDILCVYNEKMPLPNIPAQPKSFIKRVREYSPL
jgi:type IV secretion system protein VirB9